VWTHTGPTRQECAWAAAAAALPGANVVAPRFGASDCRCPAHLFHYSRQPQADELGALLQLALNKHNLAKVTKPLQGWLRPTLDEQELNALINTLIKDAASDERRERAALALGDLGDAALPPLRDLLRAPDAEHRWWAIRALAALGSPRAVSLLIQALADPDPDARVCAALGLGELKAAEAIAPLTDLLADASAYVGRIAGNALAQIGPPAIPALIQTLGSPSPAARAGAARVLVPLESHDAIPALFAALDDDSALVTHYAEQALERMGVGMVYFMP
jgi:HEAT repeat protein